MFMVERKQDTIVANASKTSKWAFILEFILVFLAVTLSFLVDNWREKQGRKESERQHMRMLLSDLKEDIHRLDSNSVVRCNREKKLDSLVDLLGEKDLYSKAPALYRLALSVDIYETFFRNDRTIIQFKNAGGMTMIRNDSISAAIMDYDGYIISEIDWNNEIEADYIYHFKEIRYNLFDAQLINKVLSDNARLTPNMFKLLPTSPVNINAIAGTVFQMKRVSMVNRDCASVARNKALNLIELI